MSLDQNTGAQSGGVTHRESQDAEVPEVVDQYLVEELLAVMDAEGGEVNKRTRLI